MLTRRLALKLLAPMVLVSLLPGGGLHRRRLVPQPFARRFVRRAVREHRQHGGRPRPANRGRRPAPGVARRPRRPGSLDGTVGKPEPPRPKPSATGDDLANLDREKELTKRIADALNKYNERWQGREAVASGRVGRLRRRPGQGPGGRSGPSRTPRRLRLQHRSGRRGGSERDGPGVGRPRRGVRRPAERADPRLRDGPQHPPFDLPAQRPHPRRGRPAERRGVAGRAGAARRPARPAQADAGRHRGDRTGGGAAAAARARGAAGGAAGGGGAGGGRSRPRVAEPADLGEDAGADRPGGSEACRPAARRPGHHRARGAAHGGVHPDVPRLRPAAPRGAAARDLLGVVRRAWRWSKAGSAGRR